MDVGRVYVMFQDWFRPSRMKTFAERFRVSDATRICDVGGTTQNWGYIPEKPQVTICNINIKDEERGRFIFRRADGTKLPFENDSFDIAFSNSVIEHVGDWERQKAFAEEMRRISKNYYVQTPNRWFFVEPHFIAPGIHLLPRALYRRLIPFFSAWFWTHRPPREEVDSVFEEIRLLDRDEVRTLFPDAEIVEETFLGMTKSFIAIRKADGPA